MNCNSKSRPMTSPKKTPTGVSLDVGKHLLKTKMCSLFLNGKCHYGADRCFYAHDQAELREKPELAKTSLCPSLRQGGCTRGNSCNYAHDLSEMTISSKKVKCLWYAGGHCSHGSTCRFSHSDSTSTGTPPFSPSCTTTVSSRVSMDELDRCQVCGMANISLGGCLCKVFKECSEVLGLL